MTYEEFKAILAQHGITPTSHVANLQHDPRASDEDIKKAEEALGVSLPEDYRRFLKEFGVPFMREQLGKNWSSFYSAKWLPDGNCELVEQQEEWDWKGKFVKIGDFDEEQYLRDTGHFGFLVVNGKCQSSVVWLDHEYNSEELNEFADAGVEILVFLLGEVIDGYKRVTGDDEDGALIIAAIDGRAEMVRLLIEEGFNTNYKDTFGSTALLHAASRGHIKIVELLLKNGADINSQDKKGNTALKLAARSGRIDAMRLLLEHGANVNAEDNDADTAMMEAAFTGRADIMKLLVENGASINQQDDAGYTPLIIAAWQGHAEVVRLLLEKGAEVNISNAKGQTALSITKNEEIRQILEAVGAKGSSASLKATRMTYEEFKAILAQHGITPDSYAVLTSEKIEIATADLGGPEEWLPTRYSSVEELLEYDSRATDDDIRQVEEALGITLPNDYVLFLKEFGGPDPLEQQREAGWGGLFSARWIDGHCQLVEQQQSWGWEGQFVEIGEFYTYEEAFNMDTGHIGFLVKDGVCLPKVVWLDPEYADYNNIAECSRELGDVPKFLLDLFKSDPANGQQGWGQDEGDSEDDDD